MSKYSDIQWVVQKNLTDEESLSAIKNSCEKIGVDYIEVDVIPFTSDIPIFPTEKKSIFYGSPTLNKLLYKEGVYVGLFFNENFSMETYISKWGRHMLNSGAIITTFKELINMDYESDKILFIRPNDDFKSFDGTTMIFSEIGEWYQRLLVYENANLDLDSKIIVSDPYNIKKEWRLWIIDGKVISASKYCEYFRLSKEEGCPNEVKKFAEQRCIEYTPHSCFVMDIALSGNSYYIIECGGMNGAGFYNAKVEDIVIGATNYLHSFSNI